MKILVTGGGGYIGSVLIKLILERGHKVKCLDRFFFGKETLNEVIGDKNLEIVKDDVRYFEPDILKGVDGVIDMAALSNDPSGELDPKKTMDINYRGRVRVAKLSKKHGVKSYILASSCSIYGFRDGLLDENSPINPLTTYAKANFLAEQDALPLSDKNFTVTSLRQATVYGLSNRMRFDLAVNGMVLGFYKSGKIPILRDGNQWRPFVHIKDTSRAFIMTMETDKETVNGQIFNIGSNEQNYQIFTLARMVAESVALPFEYEWYGSPDNRSYKINFDKAKKVLKFCPKYTPEEGAEEVYTALNERKITDSIKTKTVDWYKHLLEMHSFLKQVELKGNIL